MIEGYKLSGKFSLEYLVYLFECLAEYGTASDFFIFSQGGVPQFEISYDAERSKLFYIKILKQTSESKLNSLMERHSLKRVLPVKNDSSQTLSAEIYINVAQAMIFGSDTLLDPEDVFELDARSAQNVFLETMLKSQFVYFPFINMLLLSLWTVYEFIKSRFFTADLYSNIINFNIINYDFIEGFLLIANCYFFWGSVPNKDDIPVFKERTSGGFAMHQATIKKCLNSMVLLIVLSAFTS